MAADAKLVEEWLTLAEAGDRLGQHPDQVRQWLDYAPYAAKKRYESRPTPAGRRRMIVLPLDVVDAIGENLQVWDEWEWLAFRAPKHGNTPEGRARWQALYDGLTVGDRHLTMPLRTVEMVLLFGWSLAMSDERYADAVELMRKCYAHPEAPTEYTHDDMDVGWNLAVALLHLGNEDEALAIYTDMVHCDDRSVSRLTMGTVRWHLQTYCELQPPDGTPSQAIVEWGYCLLEWFRGPRFATRNFPAVITYEVLWQVLEDIGVWLRRDYPNGSSNSPAPCADSAVNS